MVVLGGLSPDPSNRSPDENYLQTDVGVIVASGSESEEEMSYEGYEVLPQEFSDILEVAVYDSDMQESSDDDDDSCADVIASAMRELPSFDRSTKLEIRELWNSTNSNRQTDIIIDSTKEEEIKNAMAGFKLPLTAIPPWAAEIPEEEWKEQLKTRVALLNKAQAV